MKENFMRTPFGEYIDDDNKHPIYQDDSNKLNQNRSTGNVRSTIELLDSILLETDIFCDPELQTNYVHVSCHECGSILQAERAQLKRKLDKIKKFINCHSETKDLQRNLDQLVAFASSSKGLVEDSYREKVWPILARNMPFSQRYIRRFIDDDFIDINEIDEDKDSVHDSDFESALSSISSKDAEEIEMKDPENSDGSSCHTSMRRLEELYSHKDWNQVELDVNRTLARFPPNISDLKRAQLQKELTPLIVSLLADDDALNYYQGFHDVCLTFLLVLGTNKALKTMRSVIQRGSFYNYLTFSLEESVMRELEYMYTLLNLIDEKVERLLRSANLGTLFALSWPLTWFSHSIPNYSDIVIFFDLFLCSHPLMPIYVSAALVAERREEIFSCEQEMPYLHKLLNQIPNEINFCRVLEVAHDLFSKYPPRLLEEFKDDYERICDREKCNFENRKNFINKEDPVQLTRYNALLTIAGVGALGLAAFYALSNRVWMN